MASIVSIAEDLHKDSVAFENIFRDGKKMPLHLTIIKVNNENSV
jgi:hypothetical protein